MFTSFVVLAAVAASVNGAAVPGAVTSSFIGVPGVSSSFIGVPGVSSSFIGVPTSRPISTPPSVTSSSMAPGATPPVDTDCIGVGKYPTWYKGADRFQCMELVRDCRAKTDGVSGTTYMWSKTSCVAAATCVGTKNLDIHARCTNPTFPPSASLPNLSYNVYANIVGDCAWAPGGCPITQQKYIDWFYGALSAVPTTSWPDVNVVIDVFWKSMLDWAKTGDTLPYTNFNDWLHYSNSI